jgi:hypothetical protein
MFRNIRKDSFQFVQKEVERWTPTQWPWAQVSVLEADHLSNGHGIWKLAKMFHRALAVIFVHGGVGFNLIFSKADTVVIELVPRDDRFIDMRIFIASLGLLHRQMTIAGSRNSRDLVVDLEEFKRLLWLQDVHGPPAIAPP